jgi:hypothetical protein
MRKRTITGNNQSSHDRHVLDYQSNYRVCLSCGQKAPASFDRTKSYPGCTSPDACLFDLTLEEAFHYWRQKCHEDYERHREERERLVAAMQEFSSGMEEATSQLVASNRMLTDLLLEADGLICELRDMVIRAVGYNRVINKVNEFLGRTGLSRYVHMKTSRTYTGIGEARVQTDTPLRDMDRVVVYRSDKDGELWVRPAGEFFNRFTQVNEKEGKSNE